jgi:predicted phosphodiesterase
MQRIVKEIPKNCEIVFLGDTHGGSTLTHYAGINMIVDYIASKPRCFWVHMGDWIEAIATDDKRFNADTLKGKTIPHDQADEMIDYFMRIRKKGICGLLGNHELKLHRITNLVKYICGKKNLDIPYGTTEARIIFTHGGKRLFNAFVTHRIKLLRSQAKDFIQAEANVKAALKQQLYKRMGDCAVMIAGHAHQLIVIPPNPELYLVDGPEGLKQAYLTGDMGREGEFIDPGRRWYGCSGSTRKRYVDGIDDYSDIYAPNELGFLIMTVDGGQVVDIRKFKV